MLVACAQAEIGWTGIDLQHVYADCLYAEPGTNPQVRPSILEEEGTGRVCGVSNEIKNKLAQKWMGEGARAVGGELVGHRAVAGACWTAKRVEVG